jgi:hypothetical protein
MASRFGSENLTIKARIVGSGGPAPSITLFTPAELLGGREYLHGYVMPVPDKRVGGEQPGFGDLQIAPPCNAELATVGSSAVTVPDERLDKRDGGIFPLLFEGKTAGKGMLFFDIYVLGDKVAMSDAIHLVDFGEIEFSSQYCPTDSLFGDTKDRLAISEEKPEVMFRTAERLIRTVD